MNIAYLQFIFIEKSSPYSSVPLHRNTAGPEVFLMARERKSIKFAALALPPCYLFTGLVSFPVDFFFLVLTGCFIAQIRPPYIPRKKIWGVFSNVKLAIKKRRHAIRKIPQYEGLVGAFNLAQHWAGTSESLLTTEPWVKAKNSYEH